MFTKPVNASEPSYFNLVMSKTSTRRTSFAQAAGLLPELAQDRRAIPSGGVRSN